MLTADGPQLIEINPRLVGAKIPRLVGHTLGCSVHADLIALHLGADLQTADAAPNKAGVIRWIVADRAGTLEAVRLPTWTDSRIRRVEVLHQPGDRVGLPFENADRIGYVMVCGGDRRAAEQLADRFIAQTTIVLRSAVHAPLDAEVQQD
jgi:biotin carboxylase